MKYGEEYQTVLVNRITKKRIPYTATVTGCKTEKAAKAKIRRYVTQ